MGAAVQDAFIHALSMGMWLATGVALLGAALAAVLISDRLDERKPEPAQRAHAAAEAEAVGV